MAVSNLSTPIRNGSTNAAVDDIDLGPGPGTITIATTGFGATLAVLTFSDPAFGDSSSGTATANAITADASADASGTAAVCRIARSDATVCWEGTVGTSGEDINLNTVTITAGDNVSLSSMTVTTPAAA